MILQQLLLVLLIGWSTVVFAAEVEAPSAAAAGTGADTATVSESVPGNISDSISETAPEAVTESATESAAVDENPCKGMAEGEVLGIDACNDCHADKVIGMRKNPHGQAADARTPFASDACETCHGPGTTHFDMEGNCIISLRGRFGESVEMRNNICLGCHNSDMMHWPGSTHENEDLACTSCHAIHAPNLALERTTQAEVCYRCHKDIRAQTYRSSSHPIREGKVICSDCHNPHGAPGPSALKKLSINDSCFSCHADKRGPFLWEHYPVTEDCSLCHKAHGSNHASLLNRQRPQLCQQCHQDIRAQGRRHVRRLLDFDNADPARGRFIVGESCMNCHTQVHGSNHPSGVNLLR
jgi:DmsE family decaheme c-type cytochrome